MLHLDRSNHEASALAPTMSLLMRVLPVTCLALCALAGAHAQQREPHDRAIAVAVPATQGLRDHDAEAHAFLEVRTERDAYFVHEPVRVTLRFGFDTSFLEHNVLQLFVQRLDVPVQVLAPSIASLPGAVALERAGEAADEHEHVTCALNDGVAQARRTHQHTPDGRDLTVLELEQSYRALAAGDLVIPAPDLHFAYATTFADDFVNGHVAVDRHDAWVRGAPLTVAIRPLPEEGRPPQFSGAVGRFSVRAEVEPRTLAVGETLKLALHIEGDGNWQQFEPPHMSELGGFRVYGKIDALGEHQRIITYDLAPRDPGVRVVPEIAFAFFDPGPPPGYHTVHTDAIAIDVRPSVAIREAPPRAPLPRPSARNPRPLLFALLIPCFLALALAWWRARRRRH